MAGDIKVSSNFEISAQKPLDGNINVLSVADRDSMPLIKRYDRMIVAVQGDYTYQLVLGTVDNDLSNNANWVKFGAASWADIENKPTEFEALPHTHEYIIYSETLIPTYVFGGYTAGMVTYSVKQYVINFVGEDKYINEVTAGNNHGANYLEVYEDGSLIYEQPFTFQYVDGRYRFDINEPFKAFSGKNYSLLFRRTDNTAFSATFYTSGVYYENAIAYNPVLFTVDYVLSDDSNTTGFDQSPIYYLRGSDFAKVEATGSQVQVIAEQFTVKSNTVIKKDLIVEGNIIQQGAAYETHAEQLYSTKDMLIMREGAPAGLQTGELSGFRIFKYDNINNLFFGADASGIVRVGDENGTLQALATREDNPLNGGFAKWNAATWQFETVDLSIDYAVASHDHDDRYSLLGHTHDSRYYTESEVDTKLAAKSDTTHTHDSRYYTESEVDTKLAGKLNTSGKAADSNLLDGVDGNYYRGLERYYGAGGGDPDVATDQFLLTNHSNSPDGSSLWHIRTQFYSSISSTGNRSQIAIKYNKGTDAYIRNCYSQVWTAWQKIWTNGNDGSGSGLDADVLRGYAPTSGGTASTVMLRDSSGNTYVSTKLLFSNGDNIRCDDANNIFFADVDGGTANGYFGGVGFRLHEGATRRGTLYYDAAGNYVMLHNNAADSGLKIYDSDGHATFGGKLYATDFEQSSDRKLKKHIHKLKKGTKGLEPVSFEWKDKRIKGLQYGFIAQTMMKTHPELVSMDENGMLSIKQNSILALLVYEVEKLKKQVKKLKAKN